MIIYTDGSCLNNQAANKNDCLGGWGSIIITGEEEIELSGNKRNTTNNEMELTAVIQALIYIKEMDDTSCSNLSVYSDSLYIVNAINKGWLEKWKTKNYYISGGKKRINWELFQELDTLHKFFLTKGTKIEYTHVLAHSGIEMNERVDTLARNRAEELKKNKIYIL